MPQQKALTFSWSPVLLLQRVPLRSREGKEPESKSPADPGEQPAWVIHDDQCYSLTHGAAVRIKWANGYTVLKMVPGSKAAMSICLLWLLIIVMPDTYLLGVLLFVKPFYTNYLIYSTQQLQDHDSASPIEETGSNEAQWGPSVFPGSQS